MIGTSIRRASCIATGKHIEGCMHVTHPTLKNVKTRCREIQKGIESTVCCCMVTWIAQRQIFVSNRRKGRSSPWTSSLLFYAVIIRNKPFSKPNDLVFCIFLGCVQRLSNFAMLAQGPQGMCCCDDTERHVSVHLKVRGYTVEGTNYLYGYWGGNLHLYFFYFFRRSCPICRHPLFNQ